MPSEEILERVMDVSDALSPETGSREMPIAMLLHEYDRLLNGSPKPAYLHPLSAKEQIKKRLWDIGVPLINLFAIFSAITPLQIATTFFMFRHFFQTLNMRDQELYYLVLERTLSELKDHDGRGVAFSYNMDEALMHFGKHYSDKNHSPFSEYEDGMSCQGFALTMLAVFRTLRPEMELFFDFTAQEGYEFGHVRLVCKDADDEFVAVERNGLFRLNREPSHLAPAEAHLLAKLQDKYLDGSAIDLKPSNVAGIPPDSLVKSKLSNSRLSASEVVVEPKGDVGRNREYIELEPGLRGSNISLIARQNDKLDMDSDLYGEIPKEDGIFVQAQQWAIKLMALGVLLAGSYGMLRSLESKGERFEPSTISASLPVTQVRSAPVRWVSEYRDCTGLSIQACLNPDDDLK